MAENYSVIATGPAPPSRGAMVGAELGQGLGFGIGGMLAQRFGERRLANDLNPMRAALEQNIQAQLAAGVPMTPQQQMIQAVVSDPRQFARLAGSQAGALELGGAFTPATPPAHVREVIVRGDDEINRKYGIGLQPGESATVKFTYDANNSMTDFEIGEYVTRKENTIAESEQDLMFGAGLRGRALEYVTNLSPGYAERSITPEDERKFYTSVVELLRPEERLDPDTGLPVRHPGAIPPHTRRALMMHPQGAQFLQLVEQSWASGVQPPLALPDAASAPVVDPADAEAAAASAAATPTIPPDVSIPAQDQGKPSLWELAGTGDVTGPVPSIARGIHRLPGSLLGEFPEQTEAGTYVNGVKERLIDGLRRNPRYAEGEAERLFAAIDIKPGVVDSASSFQSRVIGFDDVLAQIETEMQEVVTGRREAVSGETRQHAMDTLQIAKNTRQILAPPRMHTAAQAIEFARTAVPGAKVLVKDGDKWVLMEVEPR